MQPTTAAPRQDLTAAEVDALLRSESVTVSAGLELLQDGEVLDLSDDLDSLTVQRANYATIHGRCTLRISRELQWGAARVRPSITLDDGTTSATFYLGVFVLSVPTLAVAETPTTYDVEGFDLLETLAHPHGSSYSADAGDGYLELVADLLDGETYVLDQTAADKTLPTARSWAIDENTSTLNIINDLLGAVGYRGLWCDYLGRFRSEPYVSPADRPSEWTYDADDLETMVGENRIAEADYFDTPNRWVFILDDPTATSFPVDTAGIYTATNQSDGPASVDVRGVRSRVVRLDAVNHAALVTQGDRIKEADMRITQRISLPVAINPLHGHFDVVTLRDAALGVDGKYVVQGWSLPTNGDDMTLELKAV